MKAMGYLRVSGQGQMDGTGFDRQEEIVKTYARENKIQLLKVYRECVSGTKDTEDRDVFQEMITDMLRNGIRTIIVEGLDRLARELRVQESLVAYLASKDIQLISARTGEDVTQAIKEDPMKVALIQIQGVFSQLEKSLLVKKLKKAREKVRLEKGKCEGAKSYKEEHPELIRRIKALRRRHKNGYRRTCKEIAEILNKEGLATRRGKAFTRQTIADILHRF